tara:strand:+ start:43 stop:465 length:423 start_codon:yes stop_codon:yes gene_type:complete
MYSLFSGLLQRNIVENETVVNECPLCLDIKKLEKFCNLHRFCNECSKTWIKQNNFCPICRKICCNTNLIRYNFNVENIEYEDLNTYNFDLLFQAWHKQRCIRRKHCFIIKPYIRKKKVVKNKLVLLCKDCNIDEVFPFES